MILFILTSTPQSSLKPFILVKYYQTFWSLSFIFDTFCVKRKRLLLICGFCYGDWTFKVLKRGKWTGRSWLIKLIYLWLSSICQFYSPFLVLHFQKCFCYMNLMKYVSKSRNLKKKISFNCRNKEKHLYWFMISSLTLRVFKLLIRM